jgi:long-chain acyl-CoA synthetase
LPSLKRFYVARQARESSQTGVSRLEHVVGPVAAWGGLPGRPLPEVDLEPEDDATIIYTSGTTGKPKGALGTHRNITTHVQTTAFNVARNFMRAGEELPLAEPHLLPQRVTLLSIPLFHVSGLVATLGTTINSGGKIVLMRRWDTEQAMRLIESERVTAAGGVPTIAWQLVEHPKRSQYDLSSLRAVNYGGAASSPELVRKVSEVFPLAQPGNGWGMTETTGAFAGHLGREFTNRPTSAGVATPVGEMKILSLERATELPVGEVGELWVKGPQVAKGYWNNPRATAETFVDGWLRTGDLARLDEEGFLYLVDRMKDMLIRGGENVYCVEIENVLHSHPAVIEAAVVGIPHRTLGEEPAAIVYLRPGALGSEAELLEFARARLAAFKVPVRIALLDAPLPRNVSGKILKSEIKRMLTIHSAPADQSNHIRLS